MRVAIREQLAALVLLAVLIGLAILSIPTWIYVNRFVVGVETSGLSLTASLKAAQVASEIELIQTTCNHIATRLLLQQALVSFYVGNDTENIWSQAAADISSALLSRSGVSSNLIQARLYSRNQTGGDRPDGLFSVTGSNVSEIRLPYKAADGSQAILGDNSSGYPPSLYPNITYYNSTDPDPGYPNHTAVVARPFPDIRIDSSVDGLVLGPLVVNESFALISLTIPIRSIVRDDVILGYMTTVGEATSLVNIARSKEGLGDTGSVLLVGPSTGWNRFSKYNLPANSTHPAASNFSDVDVKFVLPPRAMSRQADRHSLHNYASGNYYQSFKVSLYDAVYKAFTQQNPAVNNASSLLSTKNEQGISVAVGYARPQTTLVNWTLIIEQDKAEAYIPIETLQHILLGCVFGTMGLTLLLVIPCAHLSVLPIRRLKAATEKSIAPPGYAEAYMDDLDYDDDDHPGSSSMSRKSNHGTMVRLRRFIRKHTRSRPAPSVHDSEPARRIFKIPGKVNDRKHLITDELTELTTTFNEMSDELLKQYTSLEEKVAERTHELEISKKAAEAANESKTLFIANISHELKTPLNGILGMCAVCMEEDDLNRVKQSLKTLYKSGDLLLHLLEDLLSFSKNQIGQQLSLEEREFRLGDIRSQVATIFDKQVREGSIDFSVAFLSTEPETDPSSERTEMDEKLPAIGPLGTGRLKDMCLWGDQHRILQVLINLVSNSLKFTPAGGKVSVRIKCLREIEPTFDESRTSSMSKAGSGRPGRGRGRMGSGSNRSKSSNEMSISRGTALSINPMDPKAIPHVRIRERSPTPPPPSAKSFLFEFEVEDTGPGIPEHMQQRVFEPFVQGDLGLSKKFGGTGLGLSICQQLANLMGGSISLKSAVGAGTTFTMHIPLKYTKDRASSTASSSIKSRPPSISSTAEVISRKNSLTLSQTTAEVKATVLDQQPRLVGLSQPFFATGPRSKSKEPNSNCRMNAIEMAKASKGGGKLRVLVAEDNPTNIEVVSKMLKLEDVYDVTIAKDGQEAYELVKTNMENNLHFDLIFMDIQMPNLDGLQSTRLIRKMGYSAPIVALTAFSEESNIQDCMESGMNEFLSKPIRRPALKLVLKKFATIPEEPETTSQLMKSTAKKDDSSATNQPPNGNTISTPLDIDSEPKEQPIMNGVHPAAGAVT
ncbi:putative histidine kinase SlnCl1 [Annulohypoxylon maeteangense]|uniref:putative histidine kinase SlnCl1 n=1 Tax=Annulohypoxylon maeteangense TaxID=1927788 RepID=UPI00200805A7|nr:putative histidine kinase SlnCl1 [Annulohypoxylon maeteangense]KAI0880271.1 putative histidine kinase SlnCl1 [Annulohypoxylon maeteangense]